MPELLLDKLFEKQPLVGEAVFAMPLNQNTKLDLTSNIGGCSGLYYSLIFQLDKWGYYIKKIDEDMSVSPIYAEAYNLTVEQKHKLEAQIKQGLASEGQAVADYELLKHDYRKYKDMLEFLKPKKEKGADGKDKKEDDHILRSMFIDRVDAFVGDQFAMINMVKRWPTIIADFIRFPNYVIEGDEKDVQKIREGLKVTDAEAHVLKSKNILYRKWKESFLPEVKDRFIRVKTMLQAREKSMYEYKEWLKPYVARYKIMEESLEGNPKGIYSDPLMAPGFGNSLASSGIRFLCWTPFSSPEMGKPHKQDKFKPEKDEFLLARAKELAIKYKKQESRIYYEKEGNNILLEVDVDGKVKKEDLQGWIKSVHKSAISGDSKKIDPTKNRALSPGTPYYIGFDVNCKKSLIKIPKGGEIEDMDIYIREYLMSENVIMMILLELDALDQKFDMYVNDIIGTKKSEDAIKEQVNKEFPDKIEEKEEPKKKMFDDFKKAGKRAKSVYHWTRKQLKPYSKYFFKAGIYEPQFKERVPKGFMIPMGGSYFGKLVKFMKWKMGVPGMPEEY